MMFGCERRRKEMGYAWMVFLVAKKCYVMDPPNVPTFSRNGEIVRAFGGKNFRIL